MTTVSIESIGISRVADHALRLKDRASTNGLPHFLACSWGQERVERLVAALLDPSHTVYATCQIEGRQQTLFVAVPFAALKPEWQFALDGIYLYPPASAPADLWRLHLRCTVTTFQPCVSTEARYLLLPVTKTPPWEALVPASLCCLEQAASLARLLSLCAPGTRPTTVRGAAEKEPGWRTYQAVPWQVLRDDARAHLSQPGAGLFFCLYPAHLADHPLLKPSWRLFKWCQIEARD
jgi:hypothetical protein